MCIIHFHKIIDIAKHSFVLCKGTNRQHQMTREPGSLYHSSNCVLVWWIKRTTAWHLQILQVCTLVTFHSLKLRYLLMKKHKDTTLTFCWRRLLMSLLDGTKVALRTDTAALFRQRPVYLVVVSVDSLTADDPRAFSPGTVRGPSIVQPKASRRRVSLPWWPC